MRMTRISVPCCEKCGDHPTLELNTELAQKRWILEMVALAECRHCGQMVCMSCLEDRACCSDEGRRCRCGKTVDLKEVNLRMEGSSAYKPDMYVMCRECRAQNAGRFRYAQ